LREMINTPLYPPLIGRISDVSTVPNSEFPVPNALNIITQICEGLSKAHQAGIVHRDIKPENILIDKDGRVKILDFGLAKLKGVSNLTKDSSTLGTIRYMSPEQVRGEDVDQRSDIWSVAVVFYELITGQVPFKGDYDQAILYAILNDKPGPILSGNDLVNSQLESIINKALMKEPDKRYQNIEQFRQELSSITIADNQDDCLIPSKKTGKRTKNILIYSGLIIIILISLFIYVFDFTKDKKIIDSIAVLPLSNLSGDPSQEYFSDGMTEAVISELANIKALKVISRTSVMRYKNTDKLLPEIAKELNVEAIVEGSILRIGNQVRITAQLIQAAEDRHLWAKNYERNLQDILLLQREVARDIVDGVRVSLSEQEKVNLNTTRQLNPEAHEAYLRGLYHWNKRSEEDLQRSIKYYEKAIDIDPNYAEAYAGLAQTYIVMVAWSFMDYKEGNPKEHFYAKKALELNENLSSGHVALAANLEGDWLWEEAEEAYKKAIELSPNYATAHQWYAELLSSLGRPEEAIKEMHFARELDPLSMIINHNFGIVYYFAREYDKAEFYFKKIIELDENFGAPHYFLYLINLARGENVLAVNEFQKVLAKDDELKDLAVIVEDVFQTSGIDGFRQWAVDYTISEPEHLSNHDLAMNYAALGQVDSAFYWLEKQVSKRSFWITHLNVDPGFEKIRSDPRFDQLLKRMNLIP
ncbi:MAG: protein kinase, partial [Calditrichia bacterium]|nr:protein kinase [Calditrichia bacterium]